MTLTQKLTFGLLLAATAAAAEFAPITDRAAFVSAVKDRTLALPLFGVRLQVSADGQIAGQARGKPVTGRWDWQGGYFCREMAWGDTSIPANCQLVEQRGGTLRFTSDQGNGRSAQFVLR